MKALRLTLLGVLAGTLAALTFGAQVSRPGSVIPFQGLFRQVAGPRWIDRAAQAQAESNFNPKAVSGVGAQGLVQWMPSSWTWAQQMGWVPRGSSPFDPPAAIQGQQAYMLWLEARCGGRLDPALGSYNAGLGSIRKAQAIAKATGLEDPDGNAWLRTLPRVTGQAHAAETRGYILHNAQNRAAIRRMAGEP